VGVRHGNEYDGEQVSLVFEDHGAGAENRPVTYVPGFFKIFDEILVNAADNKVCARLRHRDRADKKINDPTMDTLKITIDREKKQISVFNNGRGIPIEMHKKEGIMIPELIFGNLYVGETWCLE
jgi:DNA topoisomerase-2